MAQLRAIFRDIGRWLLAYENQLFGLVITPIALGTWYNLYRRVDEYGVYFANDVYTVPTLSVLTILLSALYLSITSVILLTAARPLARYETLLPNLLGVPAAFGVYAFSLISPSETRIVPVYAALLLLACGAGLVLVTLFHLRRAFSITPQARRVVRGGPYQYVRHPMYLGNLITMLGLALLFATPLAFLVAGLNCVLQLVRGRYEDRLLSATFPEYEAYMEQVGAFFPRKFARKDIAATAALFGFALFLSPCPATAAGLSLRVPHGTGPVVLVAESGPWLCKGWNDKAAAGEWFTSADTYYELDQSDPKVANSKACRAFFELRDKCEVVIDAMESGGGATYPCEEDPTLICSDPGAKMVKTTIRLLESTPACKSVIGADLVCHVLKAATKTGWVLSSRLKAILPDCADKSIMANTGSFLRLGE